MSKGVPLSNKADDQLNVIGKSTSDCRKLTKVQSPFLPPAHAHIRCHRWSMRVTFCLYVISTYRRFRRKETAYPFPTKRNETFWFTAKRNETIDFRRKETKLFNICKSLARNSKTIIVCDYFISIYFKSCSKTHFL